MSEFLRRIRILNLPVLVTVGLMLTGQARAISGPADFGDFNVATPGIKMLNISEYGHIYGWYIDRTLAGIWGEQYPDINAFVQTVAGSAPNTTEVAFTAGIDVKMFKLFTGDSLGYIATGREVNTGNYRVYAVRGTGSAGGAGPVQIPGNTSPEGGIVAADFDNDGKVDSIIVGLDDGRVLMYEFPNAVKGWIAPLFWTGDEDEVDRDIDSNGVDDTVMFPAVTDVNGDGIDDLIVVSGAGNFYTFITTLDFDGNPSLSAPLVGSLPLDSGSVPPASARPALLRHDFGNGERTYMFISSLNGNVYWYSFDSSPSQNDWVFENSQTRTGLWESTKGCDAPGIDFRK